MAKVFYDAGESVWLHLYGAGEWIVDGNDDEQPREDQNRQHSRHRRLCAEIFAAKKEGEADDHNGTAEESQPDDLGNDAGGHGEPVATRLSDAVQLVEDLS